MYERVQQSDEVKVLNSIWRRSKISKNSIKHGGWGPFQATGYSMNIPSASQFPFHFFQFIVSVRILDVIYILRLLDEFP